MQKTIQPPTIKNFIRKGIVGDYKNYFNEEQVVEMDDLVREKLDGCLNYRCE